MADYLIRDARVEDCGEILQLLKELQEFCNDRGPLKLDEHALRRDGFGEDKFFHCAVAEEKTLQEGRPALTGYLLYYWAYCTSAGRMMVVEDIYVRPTGRTRGTGSALWAYVTKVAMEKGCRKVQWVVHDWNTNAIKFYKKLGAVDMCKKDGWLVYNLDADAMISSLAMLTANKQ
ncbi:thialysine N-epsilon-acetyltransferase-like isoform X2 [Haliotis rubra]|uniref:thialysine N-epsilon-acetyltransferase-like isoform X2 n=1 Tax=Haliotis rubra TaxID=36100 RepID=UPI001EE5FAA5|nr:thialysine N-epsilon-acetyltransferase-like isoform X2 [Haliotis rubra]